MRTKTAGQLSPGIGEGGRERKRWLVTHSDANRVFSECFLKRDYCDLIDIESFGSESSFLREAMLAVKLNGLLYLTSTDGFTSCGHRTQHSRGCSGGFCVGLSRCSAFLILLLPRSRVSSDAPSKTWEASEKQALRLHQLLHSVWKFSGSSWTELGHILCTCSNVPGSLVVSWPLRTGPLHYATFLGEIWDLAEKWGWISNGTGKNLETLIKLMIDESDPLLPFGYIKLQEATSRAKANSPHLDTLLSTLHKATLPDAEIELPIIKQVAGDPLMKVKTYRGYCINGFNFHTVHDTSFKGTNNSGLQVSGHMSSGNVTEFYGQIEEIIEIEYPGLPMKQVILFKCRWFDTHPRSGTRIHKKYKIVDVNRKKNLGYYEPFVFPTYI